MHCGPRFWTVKRRTSVHLRFLTVDARTPVASCFCCCLCLPQHDGLYPQIVIKINFTLNYFGHAFCLSDRESVDTHSLHLSSPLNNCFVLPLGILSVPTSRKPLCLLVKPISIVCTAQLSSCLAGFQCYLGQLVVCFYLHDLVSHT